MYPFAKTILSYIFHIETIYIIVYHNINISPSSNYCINYNQTIYLYIIGIIKTRVCQPCSVFGNIVSFCTKWNETLLQQNDKKTIFWQYENPEDYNLAASYLLHMSLHRKNRTIRVYKLHNMVNKTRLNFIFYYTILNDIFKQ